MSAVLKNIERPISAATTLLLQPSKTSPNHGNTTMEGDAVVIRKFKADDASGVKILFRRGMLSILPAVFSAILTYPPIAASILGFSYVFGFCVLNGFERHTSLTASLGFGACSIGALYIYTSQGFESYIERNLSDDLSGIEEVYGSGGCFLVAELNGQIVGSVGAEVKDAKMGIFELRRMSVDVSVQNRGVGKSLLSAVEQEVTPSRLYLTCNSVQHAANAMYTKGGFKLRTAFAPPIAFPLLFRRVLLVHVFEKDYAQVGSNQ